MVDVSALAALVVAVVALLIAGFQLTQQILATAYVIRKCDQIVTGGLTEGAKRQWHWRQFRFTVKYQAIVFALPSSIYSNLGISSTIQINQPSVEIFERAVKTRSHRTSAQGCWISLLQDLAVSSCLLPEDICTREESGDRIPEDLTVAPTRTDAMAVLLGCIAMGMQVFKYSPTSGEITLAGSVGSISSSTHPVLGGLLHYSVFSDVPTIGLEAVKRHGHALRNREGVWANAVFGRFRDRSYRPDMVPLYWLMEDKMPVLRQQGWVEDHADDDGRNTDTIAGAACFMAFGHVDVYAAAPPSVVRGYATHFAEVIVKAHHVDILLTPAGPRLTDFPEMFSKSLDDYGFSSPYLPLDLAASPYVYDPTAFPHLKASTMLVYTGFVDSLRCLAEDGWKGLSEDHRDPSSYCPPGESWRIVCLADNYMNQIRLHISQQHLSSVQSEADYSAKEGIWRMKDVLLWAEKIMARSIRTLRAVGPPSWGNATDAIKTWPGTFDAACDEVLADLKEPHQSRGTKDDSLRHAVRLYAELSILRSAYFTIMMRAAHPLGPGLTDDTRIYNDSRIETALVYMA